MTNIAASFDSRMQAEMAINRLIEKGISQDDISLVISDKARERLMLTHDDAGDRAVKGGATGAAVGGALGALIAGLTTVATLTVPGAGILAAGPIVAALTGAGAGAAVGGLGGALMAAGLGEDEAKLYEKDLQAGKAIVVVDADDDDETRLAREALRMAGGTPKAA